MAFQVAPYWVKDNIIIEIIESKIAHFP